MNERLKFVCTSKPGGKFMIRTIDDFSSVDALINFIKTNINPDTSAYGIENDLYEAPITVKNIRIQAILLKSGEVFDCKLAKIRLFRDQKDREAKKKLALRYYNHIESMNNGNI